MPKSFPAEFRRRVLALVEAGRPVREVAADLEIAAATIYRWRTQALIDAGARPGGRIGAERRTGGGPATDP